MTSTLPSTLLSWGKPSKEWNWNKGQRRAKKRDKLSLWRCHSLDSQFACNSSFDIQMFLQIVEWWIEFLLSTESYITGFFFTFCNTIDNNYSGTISSVLVNGQTLLPPFHTIYWVKSSVKSITHCSNFYLESILIKLDI